MLVRIDASQRFDPVRPDDGEQSENAAEGGEWLDQSNSRGRTIARLVGARLRVSSACDHVVTAALRRYRREPYQAVQCVTYRPTSPRLRLGRAGLERAFFIYIGETSGLLPLVSWASDAWTGCVRFIEARLTEACPGVCAETPQSQGRRSRPASLPTWRVLELTAVSTLPRTAPA